MKRLVLAVGGLLLSPAAASAAALSLQIGPSLRPNSADVTAFPPPPGGEQSIDLVFHETGTPEDEGLFAYDLLLVAEGPISLVRVEKPDNWVFTDPDATLRVAGEGATPQHMIVNAINTFAPGADYLSDITEGTKAARVVYTVDPGAAFGTYRIRLDPEVTVFASADPNHELRIPVDIIDPGVYVYVPEPSALTPLGVAGVLALRRGRRPPLA